MKNVTAYGVVAATIVIALMFAGCSGETETTTTDGNGPNSETATTAGDHSGWWCVEHGIPEAECSMCSDKAAAECKEKGDWCDEHNRAESQCFNCDPSLATKFAKLYEAKYGEQPPKPTK